MRPSRPSWVLVSLIALILTGCDLSAGGPSIPPIPRSTSDQEPEPTEPGPGRAITSKTGKRSNLRQRTRVQSAPRTRSDPD
jgi:hypothetical protein